MKKGIKQDVKEELQIQTTVDELIENSSNDTTLTLVEKLKLSPQFTVSALERKAIKELIKDNIKANYKLSRKRLLSFIQEQLPGFPDSLFNTLYRQAENEYFQSMERIPRETLINQITTQNQLLKEKVLEESEEDITKKVIAISKLDDTVIRINRLEDTPPVVQINFTTDVDPDALINPSISIEKSIIIDQKREENG